MKYLGRFEVKLFTDGEDYRSDVGLELHDAPKDAVVGGVMTLILQLAKLDPKFMDMLAKVMAAYLDEKWTCARRRKRNEESGRHCD